MRLAALALAVCLIGSPALAQQNVDAAYRAALAETPTPSSLRADQAAWAQAQIDYPDDSGATATYRVEELRRMAARDHTLRTARPTLADLGRVCIDAGFDGCKVEHSGSLAMGDGTTIWFQDQSGSTDEEGIGSAMIVLIADGARLKPIYWLAGSMGVLPLELWRDENAETPGPTYVAVPAYGVGTGNQWVGSMFRWNGTDAAPTEIDVQTWLNDLDTRLPKGLGVWKGPTFHWAWMMAESQLWQDDDGNCCATGGEVYVDLKIDGDALAIAGLTVEDRILGVAQEVDPALLVWVSRQQHCRALTTEDPYDDDRRAQIATEVTALSCSTLDTDEAALRTTYADDTSALNLLDRAKAPPSE